MYYSVPNTTENRKLINEVRGYFFISGDKLLSVPIDRDNREDLLKYEESLALVFGDTWTMGQYKGPDSDCNYTIYTTVDHYIPNSWMEIDDGEDNSIYKYSTNDLSIIEDPSIVIDLTYDDQQVDLGITELDFTRFTNLDHVHIYSIIDIDLLQLPRSTKYVYLGCTVNMIIIKDPISTILDDVRRLYNPRIDMTMWDWIGINDTTGCAEYKDYLEFMSEGTLTKSAAKI